MAKTVKPEATPKKTEDQKQSSETISQQLKVIEEKNNKVQLAEDRRLYKRFKGQIDKAYAKMETSYLETAFALHAIYKHKLYTLDNFKNIYDFAKETYSIARGTCNNFINICEKFGIANENGNIMELSDKYKGYGISQLAVMLTFPDELLSKCNSKFSVRDLKRMRIEYENGSTVKLESSASLPGPTLNSSDKTLGKSENTKSPEKNKSPEKAESLDIANAQDNSEKSDIPIGQDKVFLCKSSCFDEMISMRGIIQDAFTDIVKTNIKKDVYLELTVRIE